MREALQEEYYKRVGQALTAAMEQRRITITRLANISGEHHRTIRGIMAGKPFMAHQMIWLKGVMNINLVSIAESMRGEYGKKDFIEENKRHQEDQNKGSSNFLSQYF